MKTVLKLILLLTSTLFASLAIAQQNDKMWCLGEIGIKEGAAGSDEVRILPVMFYTGTEPDSNDNQHSSSMSYMDDSYSGVVSLRADKLLVGSLTYDFPSDPSEQDQDESDELRGPDKLTFELKGYKKSGIDDPNFTYKLEFSEGSVTYTPISPTSSGVKTSHSVLANWTWFKCNEIQ
ncbi:MAG: hypothetical protein COT74_01515 [Bdellovibrionales bacterium CG10_big_fil_rev_8_21_14_0_10_45_34]|nr:MAG: hypothetical protein COT74_01515 [Bdellovibrionales bacterium CG10_big_fil_rev_8_21_14_0_10_45_34]